MKYTIIISLTAARKSSVGLLCVQIGSKGKQATHSSLYRRLAPDCPHSDCLFWFRFVSGDVQTATTTRQTNLQHQRPDRCWPVYGLSSVINDLLKLFQQLTGRPQFWMAYSKGLLPCLLETELLGRRRKLDYRDRGWHCSRRAVSDR